MTVQNQEEMFSAKDVAVFYNDIINQLAECDRALVKAFLDSPALTEEQRNAIVVWGATVEAIVESAFAQLSPDGLVQQ